MKRLSVFLWVFLILPISVFGCGGGGGSGNDGNDEPLKPLMGMLQFRILHNLQDDSCVARGDCFYTIEEEDQTAAWLAQIAADSDLAVLHWDRAVPWLAFDADRRREPAEPIFSMRALMPNCLPGLTPLQPISHPYPIATWRLPLCTACGTNWSDAGLMRIWRWKSPTPARMLVPARSSSFSTIPVPAR